MLHTCTHTHLNSISIFQRHVSTFRNLLACVHQRRRRRRQRHEQACTKYQYRRYMMQHAKILHSFVYFMPYYFHFMCIALCGCAIHSVQVFGPVFFLHFQPSRERERERRLLNALQTTRRFCLFPIPISSCIFDADLLLCLFISF